MEDEDRIGVNDPGATVGGPTDRLVRDGMAGAGDVLGDLNAGAANRLGPDAGDDVEGRLSPDQHRMAGEDFATDATRNDHGRDALT